MRGVDTNVLIRYIVQDDLKQSQLATHFIENSDASNHAIFITPIILCELVWVFETTYQYSRSHIADVLEKILKTEQFLIDQAKVLWNCLHDYRHLNVDFSDSYIAHLNALNKCDYTATFDKKAARLEYFKLLK